MMSIMALLDAFKQIHSVDVKENDSSSYDDSKSKSDIANNRKYIIGTFSKTTANKHMLHI